MKEVKAYQAADGTLFTGEDEALAHEAVLSLEARIDAFVRNDHRSFPSAASCVQAKLAIKAWEAHHRHSV